MMLTTRKYSRIEDFILNHKDYRIEKFSLLLKVCNAVSLQSFGEVQIDDTCFYCNFCYFGSLKNAYELKFHDIKDDFPFVKFFNKQIVKLPNSNSFIKNSKNKNLYLFTSIEETKRIQLWTISILTNFSKGEVVTAMEIPADNDSYDRTGRIDIGARSGDEFVFIETKTTLKDAMNDERFVEQHLNYTPSIASVLCTNKFLLLILIGGSETDLYPSGSEYNPIDVGGLSKRFYKLISKKGVRIPFISAAALWGLSIKYMENDSFNIIAFLNNLFKNQNIYGLVSAGVIVKVKEGFQVQKI